MKALVGTFNQEKALVGAFSVIVQPVVEPMDRFTAQNFSLHYCPPEREVGEGGHGADGEVVEQLAPDLLPDLPARLARQTVAREQGAQLLHL